MTRETGRAAETWTPEPWEAQPTDNRGWRTITACNAEGTRLAMPVAEVMDFDRTGANARLIAAAPAARAVELLLACKIVGTTANPKAGTTVRDAQALLARIRGTGRAAS